MKIFMLIKWLIGFIKKVTRLQGVLQSETTLDQYKVAMPLAVLFAVIGFVIPEYAEPQMVAAIASIFAPLIVRVALWRDKQTPAIQLPDIMVIGAQKASETIWHELNGTLMDARAEGYDLAKDVDGIIYDCHTGEPTGARVRRPNPAPEGMVKDFIDKLKKEKDERNKDDPV